MMKFEPIASSSDGNCYSLSSSALEKSLLIDLGIKWFDIALSLGYNTRQLGGCLISHGHGDHCRSVEAALQRGIPCYASAPTWAKLSPSSSYLARTLKPREPQYISGWQVTAFEAVHDAEGTFGFVVDDGAGDRLFYLTDSAFSKYKVDGVTIFAIEANYSEEILKSNTEDGTIEVERFRRTLGTHMSLETAVKLLEANDLSKVREIHLMHLSDTNSDSDRFAQTVRRATGKPTFVASKKAVMA